MKTVTRKTLKKRLPAVLKRHRREENRLAVMRKRNAHNPKLPEVQQAKATAAHWGAVRQAIADRMAADAKKAAKAELSAALADAPAVEAA